MIQNGRVSNRQYLSWLCDGCCTRLLCRDVPEPVKVYAFIAGMFVMGLYCLFIFIGMKNKQSGTFIPPFPNNTATLLRGELLP